MSSEEYLDSLLQALEEESSKDEPSPLVKKIFTDTDDYEAKEDMSSFVDAISDKDVLDSGRELLADMVDALPSGGEMMADMDDLPSGGEILTDMDDLPSGGEILTDMDDLPSGSEILSNEEIFADEEWKASLDELLAAADESGKVAEADLDKVAVDDMDVTQLIDNMTELDDSLVEINELLKKSDNNETIEEDELAAFLEDIKNEEASGEDEEALMAQLQENGEGINKGKKAFSFGKKRKERKEKKEDTGKKPKRVKKKKKANEISEDILQDKTDISIEVDNETNESMAVLSDLSAGFGLDDMQEKQEPAQKNQGFLRRLFEMLTAEEEEETVITENDEILKELELEDKKKAEKKGKKKKDKNKKDKTEDGEELEEKQPEKKKKPKKEKKKKDPIEKEIAKSKKVLSKRGFVALIAFCASLIAIIVALAFFLTDYADKKKARQAFYMGDYQEAYILLYDKTLSSSDALILERVRVILELERNVEVYEFYTKAGKEAMAMNALLEGVQNYKEILEVNDFGSGRELEDIYQDILNLLAERYGISEAEAKEMNTYSAEEYTRRVYEILDGGKEVSASDTEQDKSQNVEDILPEEEGIITLETESEGA